MLSNRNFDQSDCDAERLYLDFDSFFASAEQYFNSDLRGKPIGVVPLDSPHTGCIAISREAKALGVHSGASIKDARQIAPQMIFVVARPDAYVRLHTRILVAIETCLPVAKVRSIDEVVCHLLPSETQDAAGLAQRIKRVLAERFSSGLTCSIGIAKTELLAKISAEMNKPDGFMLLRTTELPERIESLALDDLPGISKGIKARLNAAGIRDVRALWSVERKHARALWGSVEGERFWSELHGYHVERPPTKKGMFGHSRNLPPDWRSPDKVRVCARQLALGAARRLRRTDNKASKLTVSLRGDRYWRSAKPNDRKFRWSCEVPFSPAHDDQTILLALTAALSRSSREVSFAPRSVSVTLHGLVMDTDVQPDLLTAASYLEPGQQVVAEMQRRERLSKAMDYMRASHGPKAASFGPPEELPGGYLGAKIAFGRIPDKQDFSEAPTKDEATHFCSF